VLSLLIAACVCSLASALVTIGMHLPINARIAGWDPSALPADYRDHLQTWWRWHQVRLLTTASAAIAVFVAVLVREPRA
jgi:uncharacterized membrane protein